MERTVNTPAWMHVAEIEIVYKTKVKPADRPKIIKSADAYEILRHLWNDNTLDLQEEFKVLLVNRANRVLGIVNLSCGGITGTVADPRLVLGAALKAAATGIILSHSHPSGEIKPSRADEELTEKIAQAAKFVDIRVLDHIIVTRDGYYSFADEGLL